MGPKFGNSSISMREVITTSISSGFDQKKNNFFEGCCCFKLNNLGLGLGMSLKFYISGKRVKIKSQKVLGVNSYVYIYI